MRSNIVAFVIGGVLLATVCGAQTTGIPGLNNFTMTCAGCGTGGYVSCFGAGNFGGPGGVSGSTSCTPLYFDVAAGGTFTLMVTTLPGATVQFFYNSCPCSLCNVPLSPICGLPLTSCGFTTNQSVDLNLGCGVTLLGSGSVNTAGFFGLSITVPPLPPSTCITLSIQAAIFGGPACSGPVIVTQAYRVFAAA